MVALLGIVGVALIGLPNGAASGSVPAAAAKSNAAAGIGTKAALANPDCDRETGRVAIPYQWSPPCVKAFKDGADNGGATAQGVTADSIKVVVRTASPPEQPAPSGVTNLATGAPAPPADAFRDIAEMWTHKLQGWGREIEWEFFERSGTDEAAQRVDALDAAGRKPFMVIDSIGDEIFCTEVANRNTICLGISGNSEIAERQQPYRYITGVDYWATPIYVAELVGKGLANRPAQWAGDDSMKKQKRVFGVVYTSGISGIDIDLFNKELAKWKAPKPVVALPYEPPLVATEVAADIQAKAPTIITRLKDAGVNNVVLFGGNNVTTALTKAATQQEYFPEWTMTSFQVQELDLYACGNYDQQQWAHSVRGRVHPTRSARHGWSRGHVRLVLGPEQRQLHDQLLALQPAGHPVPGDPPRRAEAHPSDVPRRLLLHATDGRCVTGPGHQQHVGGRQSRGHTLERIHDRR